MIGVNTENKKVLAFGNLTTYGKLMLSFLKKKLEY